MPVLIKDHIESADPMPTTTGSFALAKNMRGRYAPLVAKLLASGAINRCASRLVRAASDVRVLRRDLSV